MREPQRTVNRVFFASIFVVIAGCAPIAREAMRKSETAHQDLSKKQLEDTLAEGTARIIFARWFVNEEQKLLAESGVTLEKRNEAWQKSWQSLKEVISREQLESYIKLRKHSGVEIVTLYDEFLALELRAAVVGERAYEVFPRGVRATEGGTKRTEHQGLLKQSSERLRRIGLLRVPFNGAKILEASKQLRLDYLDRVFSSK